MFNNLQNTPLQVLPGSQACRPSACQAIIPTDKDAAKIGELYQQGKLSLVNSVEYFFGAGQRLIEKKAQLKQDAGHGSWLPWLHDNADVLKFDTPRTAQRLMAFAANATLPAHMDEATALTISRQLWGHSEDEHDRYDDGLLCDEDGLPRDADGKVTPDAKTIVKAIPASEAVEAVNDQDIVPRRSKQHQADIDALTAQIRELERAGSSVDFGRDSADHIARTIVGCLSEHKARKIAEAIVARLDARKNKTRRNSEPHTREVHPKSGGEQ